MEQGRGILETVIGDLRGNMGIKVFIMKQWFIVKVLVVSVIIGCIVTPPILAQNNSLPSNRIVFSWNRDGDFDLFVMDVDTQQVVSSLTDNTAADISPAWSPDGVNVALSSNVNNNYEIYVLNTSTGASSVLTNNNWDDLYPAWSPDGKQIAFSTNRDSNWDIYVMDANGKNLTRLTQDPVYEGNPVWSPDGKRIAYVEGLDAKRDIKVMDADGSNPQVLTTLATSADYSPAWSPSGDQIAFVSTRSGNPDIFVVDATCIAATGDLCDQHAVNISSSNQGVDQDPAWSPDSQQLVFVSDRESISDLYTMDATGNNVLRITSSDGEKRFPSWWSEQ